MPFHCAASTSTTGTHFIHPVSPNRHQYLHGGKFAEDSCYAGSLGRAPVSSRRRCEVAPAVVHGPALPLRSWSRAVVPAYSHLPLQHISSLHEIPGLLYNRKISRGTIHGLDCKFQELAGVDCRMGNSIRSQPS